MSETKRLKRRAFMKAAAGAVAVPMIVPSSVLGANSPSQRIQMAVIGTGSMGMGDLGNFLGDGRVQLVAVCDVDSNHRNRAKAAVDRKYGNSDCRAYQDYRELLEQEQLDAVSTALPDHWHALPAIAAAKAGCDIYGQKPFARSIREGRAMVTAVERYGRIWQTGSQQRSASNFRFACELVRNGYIGKVARVEVGLPEGKPGGQTAPQTAPGSVDWNFWLGPAPKRPYQGFGPHWNWRWIMDYSGGQLTDWCGHHVDIAHWGLGLDRIGPFEIEGRGVYPDSGLYDVPVRYQISAKYADGAGINTAKGGATISISDTSVHTMGCKWIGENGWVYVTRGGIDAHPKSLLREQIGASGVQLYKSDNHYRNFIDCVLDRRDTICPAEVGHRSISAGLLGEIAMLSGRKLRWNPDKEEFVGDDGANAMLGRAYREPWILG
jgi:predicted dehydrogenase